MAVAGAAHGSGVEIQVWHTLSGPNKAEFEKLAKKYNKEQNDVVVELRDFSSAQELKQAAADALKKKDRKSTRLNSSHYCAHRMPSSDGKTNKIHNYTGPH